MPKSGIANLANLHNWQLFNKLRLTNRELLALKKSDFAKKFVVKLTFLAFVLHIL